MKRIAVTGAAGQIAYSLLFRLIQGDLYGFQEPLALHLLDIPESMPQVEGVTMELEDCASPLLREVKIGHDPQVIFDGADFIFFIGAKPRSAGMERSDLLIDNAAIFASQAPSLSRASSQARALVVGNPCNTNAWVLAHEAPDFNHRLHAMTRLDQNRAAAYLAKKAGAPLDQVKNLAVWGNHSSSMVPDFSHASIGGHLATQLLERSWLEGEFMTQVRQRGASVIQARGKSSAASAACSALDAARDLIYPTPQGGFFSSAVSTSGNGYGIDPGLFFSFPCRTNEQLEVEIVEGLLLDDFLLNQVKLSEQELIFERGQVAHWLLNRS